MAVKGDSQPRASGRKGREPRFFGAPATAAGWCAAGLLGAFAGLFMLMNALVMVFGQEGGEGFPGNLWLFIPGAGAAACAVAGGGLAAFAIFRRGERSALAFVALFLGLMLAWILVGEALSPH